MKSDRELLELAAKAAGLQLCGYSWIGENEDDDEFEILDAAFVRHCQEQGFATRWNPLTDDGDAFRIVATLGLGIVFGQYAPCDIYSVYINEPEGGDTLSVGVIGDNESSGVVRRAIVRAAAVIGKKMP